ncbi:hypothetical protein [Hyalangium gracile]|uniref:hypothetical protein n=1 Tax=Hyalangium gracile TaxID=394092 RepID=UPI001CCAFF58|nr:hypothetical protein [Hyalangium gracile]
MPRKQAISPKSQSSSAKRRAVEEPPQHTGVEPAPGERSLGPSARPGPDLNRIPVRAPRLGNGTTPGVVQRAKKRKGSDAPKSWLDLDLPAEDSEDEDFEPSNSNDEMELTAEEREMNRVGASLRMGTTDFTALTSNVAKYAESSNDTVKQKKSGALAETVDKLHPTFVTFQEVTNPTAFQQGLVGSSVFQEHGTAEYAMLPGPAYESGPYHESYPFLYDTSMIHQTPRLSVMSDDNSGIESYSGTLKFGKQRQQPRPTTVWEFQLPTGGYNFRPPSKDDPSTGKPDPQYARTHKNLRRRDIPYQPMSVVNVHTSPSITTINKQVKDIRESVEVLKELGHSTLASGDWYAQRGAKTQWKQLEQSEDWNLAAPEQSTSFPGGRKKGQTADHFLLDNAAFDTHSATAIPPPSDDFSALEDHLTQDVSEAQLKEWVDRKIDHAPVFLHATLNPSSEVPRKRQRTEGPVRKVQSRKKRPQRRRGRR